MALSNVSLPLELNVEPEEGRHCQTKDHGSRPKKLPPHMGVLAVVVLRDASAHSTGLEGGASFLLQRGHTGSSSDAVSLP